MHPGISMHADNRGMHHMSYLASNKMTNALSDLCLPEILIEYRGPPLKFSGPSSGRGRVWNGSPEWRADAGLAARNQHSRPECGPHATVSSPRIYEPYFYGIVCSWWCQYMGWASMQILNRYCNHNALFKMSISKHHANYSIPILGICNLWHDAIMY